MKKPVIAIDGPAGAGKGTLAKKLAEALNYAYVDTGLLYRAVGFAVLENPENEAKAEKAALHLEISALENPNLRTPEVSEAASIVAKFPSVRNALLTLQKRFISHPPEDKEGLIMDGRDIGTVICLESPCKLYVTASLEIRAKRRYKELQSKGTSIMFEDVLRDMQQRDERDSTRECSPTKLAHDAVVIDTTDLDPDHMVAVALEIVRNKVSL